MAYKLKILVADDESRMYKLVKDFLVKQNYEALEAGNGSEALGIFFETAGQRIAGIGVCAADSAGFPQKRSIEKVNSTLQS